MKTMLRSSRVLFAAAMIALGITGLVNGDFALVWQHVPAQVPGRSILAYVCAVIELGFGIGLLWQRTLAWTCRLLFPYMLLWLVLLEIPGAIHSLRYAGNWGSVDEIAIMTAGAWCLFALHAQTRRFGFATGSSGIRGARWLLVVVLPMIGVGVFHRRLQHRGGAGIAARRLAATCGDPGSRDAGPHHHHVLGSRSLHRSHGHHCIHHFIPDRRRSLARSRYLSWRTMVCYRAPGVEGVTSVGAQRKAYASAGAGGR